MPAIKATTDTYDQFYPRRELIKTPKFKERVEKLHAEFSAKYFAVLQDETISEVEKRALVMSNYERLIEQRNSLEKIGRDSINRRTLNNVKIGAHQALINFLTFHADDVRPRLIEVMANIHAAVAKQRSFSQEEKVQDVANQGEKALELFKSFATAYQNKPLILAELSSAEVAELQTAADSVRKLMVAVASRDKSFGADQEKALEFTQLLTQRETTIEKVYSFDDGPVDRLKGFVNALAAKDKAKLLAEKQAEEKKLTEEIQLAADFTVYTTICSEAAASLNNVVRIVKGIEHTLIADLLNPKAAEQSASRQIQWAYSVLEQLEFVEDPAARKLLHAAGISNDAKIHNTNLEQETQLKISLVKRVLSFCHGAEIVFNHYHKNEDGSIDENKINASLKEIFGSAHAYIDAVLKEKKLAIPQIFETYAKERFNQFLSQISYSIAVNTNRTGFEKKDAAKKAAKQIEKELIAAERLANWERRPAYPIATITKQDGLTQVQVDTPIVHLTAALIEELDSIHATQPPLWFRRLSKMEQEWWFNNVERIKAGELVSPPATIRNCPMLANFSKNQTILLKNGTIVSSQANIRRGTPTPLEISGESLRGDQEIDGERKRIASLNAEQLLAVSQTKTTFESFWEKSQLIKQLENKNIYAFQFDQNLLTPIEVANRFQNYEDNNLRFRDEAVHAMDSEGKKQYLDILSTNWPVNIERGLPGFDPFHYEANIAAKNQLEHHYAQICNLIFANNPLFKDSFPFEFDNQGKLTKINNAKLATFAKQVKANLNDWATEIFPVNNQANQQANQYDVEKAQRFCMGLAAFSDFSYLWDECTGKNASKHRNRYNKNNIELFAAAQMMLMAQGCGGMASGGCKSAKDRKGAELNQVNAMMEYYQRYNELPSYTDLDNENRKNFVAIYARYIQSGHQQTVAAENSYGCNACLDIPSKFTKKPVISAFKLTPLVAKDIVAHAGADQQKIQNVLGKLNKPKKFARQLDLTAVGPAYAVAKDMAANEPRIKDHQQAVSLLQNRILAEMLMRTRAGNYLSDAAAKAFNKQVWDSILNPLEIKEYKHDDLVPVEIKVLQDLLQKHGILLNINQIKLIQKENQRLRDLYHQVTDKNLQAQISQEHSVFAYNQYIDEQWVAAANRLTQQKALPKGFNEANQQIKAAIVFTNALQGVIDSHLLEANAEQNQEKYRAIIDSLNEHADYYLHPDYKINADLLITYFEGIDITKKYVRGLYRVATLANQQGIDGLYLDSARLLAAFAQAANVAYTKKIAALNNPVLATVLLDLNTEYRLIENVKQDDIKALNNLMREKVPTTKDLQTALEKVVTPVDKTLVQAIQAGYVDLYQLQEEKLPAIVVNVEDPTNPLAKELLPLIQFYGHFAIQQIWQLLKAKIQKPLVGQDLNLAHEVLTQLRQINDIKMAMVKELNAQIPEQIAIHQLIEKLVKRTDKLLATVKETLPNSDYIQELLTTQKQALQAVNQPVTVAIPDTIAHALFTLHDSISHATEFFAKLKIKYKKDVKELEKIESYEKQILANYKELSEGRINLLPISRLKNDHNRIPQFFRSQQHFLPAEFNRLLNEREQLLNQLHVEEKISEFKEELSAIAVLKQQFTANLDPQMLFNMALMNLSKNFALLQNESFILTDQDTVVLQPIILEVKNRLGFLQESLQFRKGLPALEAIEKEVAELNKISELPKPLDTKLDAINNLLKQVKTNSEQLAKLQNSYPEIGILFQDQIAGWKNKVSQTFDFNQPAEAGTWQDKIHTITKWFEGSENLAAQQIKLETNKNSSRNALLQRGYTDLNKEQKQTYHVGSSGNVATQIKLWKSFNKASDQKIKDAQAVFKLVTEVQEEKFAPVSEGVDPAVLQKQKEIFELEQKFKASSKTPRNLLENVNRFNRLIVSPVIDGLTHAQAVKALDETIASISQKAKEINLQINASTGAEQAALKQELHAVKGHEASLTKIQQKLLSNLMSIENLRYEAQKHYLSEIISHPLLVSIIKSGVMSTLTTTEITDFSAKVAQMLQTETSSVEVAAILKHVGIIGSPGMLNEVVRINNIARIALSSAQKGEDIAGKLEQEGIAFSRLAQHLARVFSQQEANQEQVYQRLQQAVSLLSPIPSIEQFQLGFNLTLQNAAIVKSVEIGLTNAEQEVKSLLADVLRVKQTYKNTVSATYQQLLSLEKELTQRASEITVGKNVLQKAIPQGLNKFIFDQIEELKENAAQTESELHDLLMAYDKQCHEIHVLRQNDKVKKFEKLIVLDATHRIIDKRLGNLESNYKKAQDDIQGLQAYYLAVGEANPDIQILIESFDLNKLAPLKKAQQFFSNDQIIHAIPAEAIRIIGKQDSENLLNNSEKQFLPLVNKQIKLQEQLEKNGVQLSQNYYESISFLQDWKKNQQALQSALTELNRLRELFNKAKDLLPLQDLEGYLQKLSTLQTTLHQQIIVDSPKQLASIEQALEQNYADEEVLFRLEKQTLAKLKRELNTHDKEAKEEDAAYFDRSEKRFFQIDTQLKQIQTQAETKLKQLQGVSDFDAPILVDLWNRILADVNNVNAQLEERALLLKGQEIRSELEERAEFDRLASKMETLYKPVEQTYKSLKTAMATIYSQQNRNIISKDDLTTTSVNLLLAAISNPDKEQRAQAINDFVQRTQALGKVFTEANTTLEEFAKHWENSRNSAVISMILGYEKPIYENNSAEYAQKIQRWRNYFRSADPAAQELAVDNFAAPVLHYREPLAALTAEYKVIDEITNLASRYQQIQTEFSGHLNKLSQASFNVVERQKILKDALEFCQTKQPVVSAICDSEVLKTLHANETAGFAAVQLSTIFQNLRINLQTQLQHTNSELFTHENSDKLSELTARLTANKTTEKLHRLAFDVMRDIKTLNTSFGVDGLKQFITYSHHKSDFAAWVKELQDIYKKLVAKTAEIQTIGQSASQDFTLAKQLQNNIQLNDPVDSFLGVYKEFNDEVQPALFALKMEKQKESLAKLQAIIPPTNDLYNYQTNGEKFALSFQAAVNTGAMTNYTLLNALCLVRLSNNPIQTSEDFITNNPLVLDRAAIELVRKIAQLTNSHNALGETAKASILAFDSSSPYRAVLTAHFNKLESRYLNDVLVDQTAAKEVYAKRSQIYQGLRSATLAYYLTSIPGLSLSEAQVLLLDQCTGDINLSRTELIQVLGACRQGVDTKVIAAALQDKTKLAQLVSGKNSFVLTEKQFEQIKAEVQYQILFKQPLTLKDADKLLSDAETTAAQLFVNFDRLDQLLLQKIRQAAKGNLYDSAAADLDVKLDRLANLVDNLTFLETKLAQFRAISNGEFTAQEEINLFGGRLSKAEVNSLSARFKQSNSINKKINQILIRWFGNLDNAFDASLVDSLESLNLEVKQALLIKRFDKKIEAKLSRTLQRMKILIPLHPELTNQQLEKIGIKKAAIQSLLTRYNMTKKHFYDLEQLEKAFHKLSETKVLGHQEKLPAMGHAAPAPHFSGIAPHHSIIAHLQHTPHKRSENKHAGEVSETVVEESENFEELGRDVSASIAEGFADFEEENRFQERSRSVSPGFEYPQEEKPRAMSSAQKSMIGVYEIPKTGVRYAVHENGGVSYSREEYQTEEKKSFLKNFNKNEVKDEVYKQEKDVAHDIARQAYDLAIFNPGENRVADLTGGKEYEKLLIKIYIWLKAIDPDIKVNINGKEFHSYLLNRQIKKKRERFIVTRKDEVIGRLRTDIALNDQRLDADKISRIGELAADPDKLQLRR